MPNAAMAAVAVAARNACFIDPSVVWPVGAEPDLLRARRLSFDSRGRPTKLSTTRRGSSLNTRGEPGAPESPTRVLTLSVGTESRRNEDALIATGTRRRPGRVRAWGHRVVGVIGWIALILLALWRLPESPPWRLPLPIGLMLLAFAALLVLAALLWARMADRRRRPRPGPAKTPPRIPRQRPVPDRVAR